jgi:hypothetical protein
MELSDFYMRIRASARLRSVNEIDGSAPGKMKENVNAVIRGFGWEMDGYGR